MGLFDGGHIELNFHTLKAWMIVLIHFMITRYFKKQISLKITE